MTTKAEKNEAAADQHRTDVQESEADRQTHLVDPMTHPSSGDPPVGMTPNGDRLGAAPLTRNAIADTEQAKQEGLEAAKSHEPTKAEKASGHKAARKSEKKTQTPSKDGGAKKTEADTRTKASEPEKPDDAPVVEHAPVWPFSPPKNEPAKL